MSPKGRALEQDRGVIVLLAESATDFAGTIRRENQENTLGKLLALRKSILQTHPKKSNLP